MKSMSLSVDQIIVKFKSPQLQATPAEALTAQAGALSARARMIMVLIAAPNGPSPAVPPQASFTPKPISVRSG